MAAKLPVWGIDVGQCSLKAMKLQASDERVELLAVDVVEHDAILSQAESDAPEMIKKAIETFLSRNDIKESRVVVSVPGQQTLTRFTKMPPVESKKIPDMVQYEAGQQIPFDMDEVVWDYQVFAEEDSPDVEVGIFAIRKELIRNHLTHFMDQGIEPIVVQTSPMASYNAACYERPTEAGEATILLDMGALATDLIIFEGNRIWSRPVPIGGNRFTDALVSAFKISFRKGERLKRSASSSKYARQVFQAMRPVFADLVSEVQRSIGFYTSTHREARIKRVLGMGNAFKLPGLQKFLQQNLQIKVEKITAFKKLRSLVTERSSEYSENVMSFGVAYGLALQGLDLAAVDASLLPLEVQRSLTWRKKRAWFGGAAACLALAAGSLWVGTVMAGGQLAESMGSLTSLRPKPPASIDQAEQQIARGRGSMPAVERAVLVSAAAEKLQQEFKKVSGKSGGDEELLKDMAKMPANNVLVPRIVDVIHRVFWDAARDEVKAVKTARDYKKLAEQLPRSQRRELWIRELALVYSKTPERKFYNDESIVKTRTKPGWFVTIKGESTESDGLALAKLIDEKVISGLNRVGKEPNRGIYFAEVALAGVEVVSDSDTAEPDFGPQEKMGRPGGRPGARLGGRPGGRPGRPGGRPSGRGQGPNPPMGGDPREPSMPTTLLPPGMRGPVPVLPQLKRWGTRLFKHDPLTMEDTSKDHQFTVKVLVYKRDTPDDLIPEEYKEQQDGNDKGASP